LSADQLNICFTCWLQITPARHRKVYFRIGFSRITGSMARQQARATLMRPARLAVRALVSEQDFATK
jgi:hypothetical protein